MAAKRRFELHQPNERKFCEMWLESLVIRSRFGAIGRPGTPYSKTFLEPENAEAEFRAKIGTLLAKGYVEVPVAEEALSPPRLVPPGTTPPQEETIRFPVLPAGRAAELEKQYFGGASLDDTLRARFHFGSFRPNQREAIHQLLEHQRLLCILPTGRGKSLLFQLPASLLPGLTVVLSPLKALMRDQVEGLRTRFGIPAATLNSDQEGGERRAAREAVLRGGVKLLYLAPEQLGKPDIQYLLTRVRVDMLVVDEAHCISTWGHDFRPSYREMSGVVEGLSCRNPGMLLLGLTATADRRVAEDISRQFALGGQGALPILRDSANRPNLRLRVIHASGQRAKLDAVRRLMDERGGPAIVYCATRKSTALVADTLAASGYRAEGYHGALEASVKHRIQAGFQGNQVDVVAATNSLGMGIDKGDVRQVIHYEFPGNLTNYYQEIGRAGRDGEASFCTLIYDPRDKRTQEYFLENAQPTPKEVEAVLRAVAELAASSPEEATAQAVCARARLDKDRAGRILVDLLQQGLVAKEARGWDWVYRPTGKRTPPDTERYERLYEKGLADLGAVMAYAEMRTGCHMQILRKTLGDEAPGVCGHCGSCARPGCTERWEATSGGEETGRKRWKPTRRNSRRSPGSGRPWSEREVERLRELTAQGKMLHEMKEDLERRGPDIKAKLKDLGLVYVRRQSQRGRPPEEWTGGRGRLRVGRSGGRNAGGEKAYDVSEIRRSAPKAYAAWSEEEEGTLRGYFGRGVDIRVIAKEMQRKPGAIRMRLRKMGLMD